MGQGKTLHIGIANLKRSNRKYENKDRDVTSQINN